MDQTSLVQSAQRGNLESFNQLILQYQDQAYSTALYLMNGDDCAADALQNALILAFNNISRFRGGSFRAWLLKILKNVCYDELRRQKRNPHLSLEPLVDGEEFDSPIWLTDHEQNPGRQVESADLSRAIESSIRALSPEYRLALILVDIDGMDYTEAADVMGVPMGTVKSRLARARLRMRSNLQHYADLLPEIYTRSRRSALGFAHEKSSHFWRLA